jgi:hypothetical protein
MTVIMLPESLPVAGPLAIVLAWPRLRTQPRGRRGEEHTRRASNPPSPLARMIHGTDALLRRHSRAGLGPRGRRMPRSSGVAILSAFASLARRSVLLGAARSRARM